jgi:hypothetical protein
MSFDFDKILNECRKLSTEKVKEWAALANKRPMAEVGVFFGLLGSLTFQTTACYLVMQRYRPGSKEGEEMLRGIYDSALKDTLERWNKDDIKVFDQ